MTEEKFCEELQELLDRYKTQLSVPAIMRNAQKIFRNTLSIRENPELKGVANDNTTGRVYTDR